MGNANIDNELKNKIERLLKNMEHRVKYRDLKGFIDIACFKELQKIKKDE